MWKSNFYPRPPRGGRHIIKGLLSMTGKFLSTPSARRATVRLRHHRDPRREFLSTPSARRATVTEIKQGEYLGISIHALREEGDEIGKQLGMKPEDFYPRPPRGGRQKKSQISQTTKWISIHALREEGDVAALERVQEILHFYPRPPRGGRPDSAGSWSEI